MNTRRLVALAALNLALLFPLSSLAEDCIDYGRYLNWIDFVYSGDVASRIDGTDSHLYLTREQRLDVLDISDPDAPVVVGSVNLPNECNNIAVGGDYVYLATGQQPSVLVVDVSEPTTPTISTEIWQTGTVNDLAWSGDVLYVANRATGLHLFDTTDPTDPMAISNLNAFENASVLTLDGDYTYVSSRDEGMFVIELDEFSTPSVVGFVPVWGWDVAVADGYAYLPWDEEITVVDVTTPTSPQEVAVEILDDDVYAVALFGTHVIGAGWNLDVLDISDPNDPSQIGRMRAFDNNRSRDLVVVGDRIYVNAAGVISIFDTSALNSPEPVAHLSDDNNYFDMAVRGDYVYVIDFGDGMAVIDISDPLQPLVVGSVDTPNTPSGIELHGDYAYIADGTWGVRIVDISDPSNPFIAGELSVGLRVRGLHAEGDFLYLAIEFRGLQIYDISTPTAPIFLGRADVGDAAWDVQTLGSIAYVTDVDAGLFIVDASDPVNPTIEGTIDVGAGGSRRLTLEANTLYYTRGTELFAIDVADPLAPAVLSSVESNSNLGEIAIGPSRLYVEGASVLVVDSTDPAELVSIGHAMPTCCTISVGLKDQYVLLANGPDGFYVYPRQCLDPAEAPILEPAAAGLDLWVQPNPGRGPVSLELDLAGPAYVRLEVFDSGGRRVWNAPPVRMAAGRSSVTWNGMESQGLSLPAGVYVVRARTPAGVATAATVLLR